MSNKVITTYRVDFDLLKAVQARAKAAGETATDVIMRAFRAYVAEDAPVAAPAAPGPVKRSRAKAPPPSVPAPPVADPRVSAGTATAVFQPAGAEPVATHPVPARTVDEAAARLKELRAMAAASPTETVSDFEELARRGIEGHLAEVAAQGAPPKKNCKHPKVRVKGTCPDCFAYVASKS